MPTPTDIPQFAINSVNLASPRLGTTAVFATDEFFAPKERMLADRPAVFVPDKYDDNGKWMDGWETRRRRDGDHDWCLVQLGVSGMIDGFDIDTRHFTGNYAPAASIEACLSVEKPDENSAWQEILPATDLGPDAQHFLAARNRGPWNWLRLHMWPDGGIARLRVFGTPACDWVNEDRNASHELSALKNGGRVIAFNDAHYGDVWSILTEGRGANMGDGWETRRRRDPGNDWLIVSLGHLGEIDRIEVDTAHFKGNFPDRCSVQAACVQSAGDHAIITQAMFWPELMREQRLTADTVHVFQGDDLQGIGAVSHVKLNIFPDGGISRFRVFGRLAG